jgi:membrane protease YdiL (CAAX protease family)
MEHLRNSFIGKNHFWRYLIMIAVIFLTTNTIGAIPLLITGIVKSVSDPNILTGGDFLSNLDVSQNFMFALMLFPFIAGLATYALLIKPLHGRSFLQTITGKSSFRWKHFCISGGLWMILMGVTLFVYIGFDPDNFTINNISSSLIPLILLSFLLIPFQAAFEEVIFRGYLMQGFTALFPLRIFALLATAVLFALMHSVNPEVKEFGFFSIMPQYLTFGLIFGLLTILDNGIESALGAHAANNIFLCIFVTQKASALQTPALFEQRVYCPGTELIVMIIVGTIFIFTLYKIFGWKNISSLFKKDLDWQ